MTPPGDSGQDQPARLARRVAANTISLIVADVASKVMMFVFYVIAARRLGIAQYGVLSFAFAFVMMLAVLTDMGLGATAAREIARDRSAADRVTGVALPIRFCASIVVIAVIALLVNLLGYPARTIRVVYICAIFVMESAITGYLVNVFQGFEKMYLTAVCRVFQTGVLLLGVLLVSRGPAVVERYALVYVSGGLVSALAAGALAHVNSVRPKFSLDLRTWWRAVKPAAPIGAAMVLVPLYYWNGTALLSKLSGDEAVGAYSAALRLVMGAMFVSMSFSAALYPQMARLHVSDPAKLRRLLEMSIRYVILLVLPIGAVGVVASKALILLVYGTEYAEAVGVLRVLVWWGVAASLSSVLSNYFIAIDRPSVMTYQAALSLATNLVGNVLLIPLLGALGAAVSIVAAELAGVVYLGVRHLTTPHAFELRRLLLFSVRALVALALAASLAWYIMRFSAWAAIGLAVVTYAAALPLAGALRREDWEVARVLLLRGRGPR